MQLAHHIGIRVPQRLQGAGVGSDIGGIVRQQQGVHERQHSQVSLSVVDKDLSQDNVGIDICLIEADRFLEQIDGHIIVTAAVLHEGEVESCIGVTLFDQFFVFCSAALAGT